MLAGNLFEDLVLVDIALLDGNRFHGLQWEIKERYQILVF